MSGRILKKIRTALIWHYYFLRFAVRQFYRQRGLQIASSLAYTTLLSLVPLMIIIYGVVGGLPMFESMGDKVETFIIENFVPAFSDTLQQFLRESSRKASQLTFPSVSLLIVMALMLLQTIDNALNIIWHVRVQRRPVARFLVYWAILTLGPLLVLVGLGLSTYVLSLSIISDVEATLGLKTRLLSWIPFLTSTTAFTLTYILIPNCVVSKKHALVGGLIAAILFEIAKYGFLVYIKHASYQDIYGPIFVIPIFLIWIYTLWVIVILGAHITFCLSAFRLSSELSGTKGPEWNFTDACRVINALWNAQKSGGTMTGSDLRKAGVRLPHYQLNEIMNALHEANWIHDDPKGGWILSRDMSELTLMDLYRIIPNRIALHHDYIDAGDATVRLDGLLRNYNDNLSNIFDVSFKTVFPGKESEDTSKEK